MINSNDFGATKNILGGEQGCGRPHRAEPAPGGQGTQRVLNYVGAFEGQRFSRVCLSMQRRLHSPLDYVKISVYCFYSFPSSV